VKEKVLFLSASIILSVFTLQLFYTEEFSLISTAEAVPTTVLCEPTGSVHDISMQAVKTKQTDYLYAYQLTSHTMTLDDTTTDITKMHSLDPTIPGPTIVIDEGDKVRVTVSNALNDPSLGIVGVHVHGVAYDIKSDGTLEETNRDSDQGAPPAYTVEWVACKGTAGSWPYHDHTLMGINGLEYRGLFGAVIVNPASGEINAYDGSSQTNLDVEDIAKDFVVYARDDAFWIQEIDYNKNSKQTPLGVNPILTAKDGDFVRWNIIPLGNDIHKFYLDNYQWFDEGTTNLISEKDLGPLEHHVFTIKAKKGSNMYGDDAINLKFKKMFSEFEGTNGNKPSKAGLFANLKEQ